jgi:hypothetical protein
VCPNYLVTFVASSLTIGFDAFIVDLMSQSRDFAPMGDDEAAKGAGGRWRGGVLSPSVDQLVSPARRGEVFSVTLARESVRAAKFLIAGEPAEYRGSGRHRGIGADGPEAFTVDEPAADRFSDLGTVVGRAADWRCTRVSTSLVTSYSA